MAKKSPLELVKDRHGSKAQLVDKLAGMVDRGDETADELKQRLRAASNAKLLRLHDVLTEVSQRFGGKEQLVDAILALKNQAKDADYRARLLARTPIQLLARHRELERRARKQRAA